MSQMSQFVLIRNKGFEKTKIVQDSCSKPTRIFELHFNKFLSKLEEDNIISNDFSSDYLSNSKSRYNLK